VRTPFPTTGAKAAVLPGVGQAWNINVGIVIIVHDARKVKFHSLINQMKDSFLPYLNGMYLVLHFILILMQEV